MQGPLSRTPHVSCDSPHFIVVQVDYKPPDGGFLPWSSDAIQLEVPRLAFRGLGPPDGAE